MNRKASFGAFILLGATLSFAQSTPAAPQSAGDNTAAAPASAIHGIIAVQLAKSIDSKKLKQGDQIEAKTLSPLHLGSGTMIPSGSKVIGHVTESTARSKGDPGSSLGIVFDKIEWGGGKEMPMKGVLQAIGPNPQNTEITTGAAGSGTMAKMDGTSGTMATTPGPMAGPGAPLGHGPNQPQDKVLRPTSTGVVAIKGLEMDNNSVLTSSGKEVRLDTGMELLVKAE